MAKAKKEVAVKETAYDKFKVKMAQHSLGGALKLADEYDDLEVEFVKTGYPSFNLAINKNGGGLPRRRHVEIFSKKESAGKTSIALGFAKDFQDAGLSVGVIDIEKTITGQYLKLHKLQTTPGEDLTKIPITIMRSEIDPDTDEKFDLYLENVLDTITEASKIYDLLIIDSVDALVTEEEAQKSADKNARVGGISMKLSQFFRKNTNTHACIIWINQTRQSPGAYSPQGGVTYVTSGGRALPFYASVRLELTVVEKLKEGDNDPYGFQTKVLVVKNKVGDNWRVASLNYINGEGFSKAYDYFSLAIKTGIILKNGAWFYFIKNKPAAGLNKEDTKKWWADSDNTYYKGQGELNTYKAIKDDPELFKILLSKVSGDEIVVEEADAEVQIDDTAGYTEDNLDAAE
jgi:recombination protein RecA